MQLSEKDQEKMNAILDKVSENFFNKYNRPFHKNGEQYNDKEYSKYLIEFPELKEVFDKTPNGAIINFTGK